MVRKTFAFRATLQLPIINNMPVKTKLKLITTEKVQHTDVLLYISYGWTTYKFFFLKSSCMNANKKRGAPNLPNEVRSISWPGAQV